MKSSAFSERQPFGGDAQCALSSSATLGLSTKYFSMADDGNLTKEKREAAMLLSVAERHLSSRNAKDCLEVSEQALKISRQLGDGNGEADALSLKIGALRLRADLAFETPVDALRTAEQELSGFTASGNARGAKCMVLALAELKAAMYKEGRNLQEATENVEEALSFFAEGDKAMHAKALLAAVAIYYQRRKAKETHEAANLALKLFKGLDDLLGQARSLHGTALAYAASDDFENAAKFAKRALAIYEPGDRWEARPDLEQLRQWEEAFELRVLALWYMLAEKPQKAMRPAKDAVVAMRLLRSQPRSEAGTLLLYIEVLIQNYRETQALKEAEDNLQRCRDYNDKVGIVSGLEVLVHTHVFLGSASSARETAEEALSKARDLRNPRLVLSVLYSKSNMHTKSKEHEDAVLTLRDAVAVAKTLGDPVEEAEANRFLSIAELTMPGVNQANIDAGREAAQAAQTLYEQRKYIGGLASVATIKAFADFLTMDAAPDPAAAMVDAVEGMQKAQVLYHEIEDRTGEGDALSMLSMFYLEVGDVDNAIVTAQENVSFWKNLGVKKACACAMHYLASISLRSKDYETAEQEIKEAQRLCREVGAKGVEANLMLLLTQVLIGRMSAEPLAERTADPLPEAYVEARAGAFDAIKDALVLAVRAGDDGLRASALFWRSEVLVWALRQGEALKSAQEAETSFGKIKDGKGLAHTRCLIADLLLMAGKVGDAKTKAAEALEFARSSPDGAEVEAPAQAVLARIAAREAEEMGRRRRPAGGRGRMVRQLVKKRRKKGGSAVAAGAKPGMDLAVVLKKVDGMVRNVLSDEDDVAADMPFMEAGIDSLASVQLVTDLSKGFGMPLAPSIVFDFPTMRTLSEHLAEEAGAAAPAVAGAGEDEWEEYEEWEDVEVPDDDYDDYSIEPVRAIEATPQVQAAAASALVAAKPKGLDLAMVRPKVMDLVKQVIASDEEDLSPDTPFMEAGVDSLGSVQLVTDVGRAFQIPLAPSSIFDYPTIRSLADHLVEESMNT